MSTRHPVLTLHSLRGTPHCFLFWTCLCFSSAFLMPFECFGRCLATALFRFCLLSWGPSFTHLVSFLFSVHLFLARV